ncbi:LytTR family DNA-binding domain-containing protein [Neolewinella litorea]|uniref:LytTR family transcriptional regulator n=1 Tax=Neolewinella litorea TaxID=2562452 RepID=A0A4S4NEK6_9BACT|nr:LytTR family DNA-binding domain-containing protein [Neolewinella litorea]THH36548.1 LytTR family transcriptional regulator [Neolewinella litorea]
MLGSPFPYGRSLGYLLATNLYGCLLGYGILTVFILWGGTTLPGTQADAAPAPAVAPTLSVKIGGLTTLLPVADLRYALAEKPYVALHTADRKYLVSESLNELAGRLSPHGFVRVHKSSVVRLSAITGYLSRRNGDYDLALEGGRTQRLSRHYLEAFVAAVAANTGGQKGYTGQQTQAARLTLLVYANGNVIGNWVDSPPTPERFARVSARMRGGAY